MLKHLYIENITIIKKICIDFRYGLNVIVGQTGSGKSVVLDCIELVTGGRAKGEIVRKGEQKAIIIADFEHNNSIDLIDILKQNSIEINDTIALKRVIYPDGKNSCFINDMPTTLSLINKISNYLIEINGQFVQGRLLEASEHLKMLDEYAVLRNDLVALKELFATYSNSKKEHQKLLEIKDKIATDYDHYCGIVKDIEKLQFIEDEDNKLLERKKILLEQDSTLKVLEETIALENGANVVRNIKKIAKNISSIKHDANEELIKIANIIEQSAIEFCEGMDYISGVVRKTGNAEAELEIIEDRLYQIRQICRKYNVSSTGLSALYETARTNIDTTDNIEDNIIVSEKKVKEVWQIYLKSAKIITQKRRLASHIFVDELHEELTRLKMEHAKMAVIISDDENLATSQGIDSVHFAASTNPGMPIMPINKIASGGELSRFMLAFKSVMSKKVSLPSIIFDEIDSGTSGIVASLIAEFLYDLSKKTQVLAVTHSHQVVKRGDTVLRISKQTDGIETVVNADHLDTMGIIKEIEMMISGIEI